MMNRTARIVVGSLLFLAGGVVGFAVGSFVGPVGGRAGESANLRTEPADVRAELHAARRDAESARAELTRPGTEADQKWARQVAELFLNAVCAGGDEGPAVAVCTRDCRARQMTFFGPAPFIDNKNGSRASLGKLTWSITSNEVSPSRDRAAFHGLLDAVPNYWAAHKFQLMMVKEDGDWKVSAFVYQEKGPR